MKLDRYRTRAGLAVAAALPLVAGALAVGIPSAQAASHDRQMIANTKPQWATAKADHGAVAGSTTVHARVYLAGRDAAGLAAYARAVSDPSSASYGKYLTAKQAKARFGATKEQVAEVTKWLRASGLKITASTEHYIAVTGNKAAVEKAFGTELHNYATHGHTYHAPSTTASVPTSLHGAVLTVTGLNNAPNMAHTSTSTGNAQVDAARRASVAGPDDTLPPPDAVFRNSGPFSTYYGSNVNKKLPMANGTHEPYAIQGYTGKQLRAAYGAKTYTGKGATVAVVDAYASPTIAQDAAQYAENAGDPKYKPGQLTQVLPSDYNSTDICGAAGWYGEESLDVEAVHAVAPAANIVYVGASSCYDDDLLASLALIVDHHLADIVSNSWSGIEADSTPDSTAAYDQVFQMGATEGIGFYFSTGDDGDYVARLGEKMVGTPADSSWATAVGGTSLAVGKGDKYKWESGWGTHKAMLSPSGDSWVGFPGAFTSGAGGGTSALYAQPYYQRGIVPAALSQGDGDTPMRVLPDISAVADPTTGMLVGQSQTFPDGTIRYSQYRIGGTSLACPVTAAVQALAQQARGGIPIGFANPEIYRRYGTSALHDVTDHPLGAGQGIANVRVDFANAFDDSDGLLTSLRSMGMDSSLSATVGYDNVTGAGTPGADYVTSYRPKH